MKLLAEVASSRSEWRKSSAMDGTCDAGSRVAFELDPVPGGTRVTVRESLAGPVCVAA